MFLKIAAALMFISLTGPSISEFNPGKYGRDYTSCPAPAEKSCRISSSENTLQSFLKVSNV
jgi:hypothetical protein